MVNCGGGHQLIKGLEVRIVSTETLGAERGSRTFMVQGGRTAGLYINKTGTRPTAHDRDH